MVAKEVESKEKKKVKTKKAKPPLAAQIIYGFSVASVAIVVFGVVLATGTNTSDVNQSELLTYAVGSIILVVAAQLMRNGSYSGLMMLSILLGLSWLGNIIMQFGRSEIEKIINPGPSLASWATLIITSLLLLNLWANHRSYFK